MPTLRIKHPATGEVTHVLRGDRISVGRRPDNTIQILDRSVSAHHAELILEGDHYRLHDLASTNNSFVEGEQVFDFHLHRSCTIMFGSVECEYDATLAEEEEAVPKLTPAQLEKDMAFLRAENQDLLNTINSLQRRIDILSSARLITGRSDASDQAAPEQLRKVTAERDELRYHLSGVKLELENLRHELAATARERDTARQANEILQAEKAALQRELFDKDKGATQRIVLPPQPSEPGPRLEREDAGASGEHAVAAAGQPLS